MVGFIVPACLCCLLQLEDLVAAALTKYSIIQENQWNKGEM